MLISYFLRINVLVIMLNNRHATMIVSVLNNKGGTGKTTTSVNLAAATAIDGKKTLLVDLDPQGNATTGLGFEKATLSSTIYNVLSQTRKAEEVLLSSNVENLSLLPSNLDLAGAEVELSSTPGREYVLRESLTPIKDHFGNIVIDCPPNIGLLSLNALVSSDLVLIPVQCEFYPMEGLPTLLKVMDLVKSRLKAAFDFRIVLTMYDRRTALSRRVAGQVKENFGERVLKSVIPRSIRMAEAPSKGQPGIVYRPKNPAAEQYRAMAKELQQVKVLVEA
jgi:chromosome partitioning protein